MSAKFIADSVRDGGVFHSASGQRETFMGVPEGGDWRFSADHIVRQAARVPRPHWDRGAHWSPTQAAWVAWGQAMMEMARRSAPGFAPHWVR